MEHKKAVAATLAAMISATGAATEASFEDPADLLQNNKPDPHVEYIGAAADDVTDDDDSAQDEEKQRVQKKGGGVFREKILELPVAVRAIFILPQWIIGNVVVWAGNLLFAGLSPVLNWALGFVVMALVIMAIFTITAKVLFPDLPLRKILNRHTFKWVLIVSLAASAADVLLGVFWTGYTRYKYIVIAVLTLVASGSLVIWFSRREKKRRAKAAEKGEDPVPAEEEKPVELMYSTGGQTYTFKPRQKEK